MKMATDQVRIRSLYEGLYRNVIVFGLLVAAAWLFAVFSYYLSEKTGTDWFTRSGAIMGLVGAAVTFRLAHFYQRALATALQRRSRIGAERDRAWPRTAQAPRAPLVFRLSDRHRRNGDLGLWGSAAQSDVLR